MYFIKDGNTKTGNRENTASQRKEIAGGLWVNFITDDIRYKNEMSSYQQKL